MTRVYHNVLNFSNHVLLYASKVLIKISKKNKIKINEIKFYYFIFFCETLNVTPIKEGSFFIYSKYESNACFLP